MGVLRCVVWDGGWRMEDGGWEMRDGEERCVESGRERKISECSGLCVTVTLTVTVLPQKNGGEPNMTLLLRSCIGPEQPRAPASPRRALSTTLVHISHAPHRQEHNCIYTLSLLFGAGNRYWVTMRLRFLRRLYSCE
jgi:hypothetical protein